MSIDFGVQIVPDVYKSNWFQSFQTFKTFQSFNICEKLRSCVEDPEGLETVSESRLLLFVVFCR